MTQDERAALAALEALQRDLEAYRKRREAASAAFDSLLRSVDEMPGPRARPAGRQGAARVKREGLPAAPGAPEERDLPASAAGVPQESDRAVSGGEAQVPAAAPSAGSAAVPTVLLGPPPRQGTGWRIPLLVLIAAAAAILAAWGALRPAARDAAPAVSGRESAPATGPQDGGGPAAVPEEHGPAPGVDAAVAGEGSPASGAEAAIPAAPFGDRSGIVTERRVWVRVTLDGRRLVERELDPGARIPVGQGDTLVVRAGDGGAVRVYVRGTDRGLVGGDGQVVTRTFELR